MRYTYHQRQDRRENQGDVSEEGVGTGRVPSPTQGGEAWSGEYLAILRQQYPHNSARELTRSPIAIPLKDTRGSHTPQHPQRELGVLASAGNAETSVIPGRFQC